MKQQHSNGPQATWQKVCKSRHEHSSVQKRDLAEGVGEMVRNFRCSICGAVNKHYAKKCPKATQSGTPARAAASSARKRPRKSSASRRVKARAESPELERTPSVVAVIAPPVVVADLDGNARASAAQVTHMCETSKSPDEVKGMKRHADAHARDDFDDTLYDLNLYDNEGYEQKDFPALWTDGPCLAILLARLARTRVTTTETRTLNFPEAITPGYILKDDYKQDTTFSMRADTDGPTGPCIVRWMGALRRCVPRVRPYQRYDTHNCMHTSVT